MTSKIYLIVVGGLWLKTRNKDYYYHARFWSKLYVLNFGIGVASGIPMEFESAITIFIVFRGQVVTVEPE